MRSDINRILILMVATGVLLYWFDPVNVVVFQAILIAMFQAGNTHFIRRILFPAISLQEIAKKAVDENNMAAALVFCSIIAFLIATMYLSTQIFKV